MRSMLRTTLFLFAAISLLGCTNDGTGFALYRDSVIDPKAKIKIAVFGGNSEDQLFNKMNCEDAGQALQKLSSISSRHWCEPV